MLLGGSAAFRQRASLAPGRDADAAQLSPDARLRIGPVQHLRADPERMPRWHSRNPVLLILQGGDPSSAMSVGKPGILSMPWHLCFYSRGGAARPVRFRAVAAQQHHQHLGEGLTRWTFCGSLIRQFAPDGRRQPYYKAAILRAEDGLMTLECLLHRLVLCASR